MNNNTKLLKTRISRQLHNQPYTAMTVKKIAKKYHASPEVIKPILNGLVMENQLTKIKIGISCFYCFIDRANITAREIQSVRGSIEKLYPGL